jgi:hypothetical protein
MTGIEYLLEKMQRDIILLFKLILRNQLVSAEAVRENKNRKRRIDNIDELLEGRYKRGLAKVEEEEEEYGAE